MIFVKEQLMTLVFPILPLEIQIFMMWMFIIRTRYNLISLQRLKDGTVHFSIESRGKYQLPPPSSDLANRIINIARSITHIDADQGREPVSLGLRNDRMDITFQFDRKPGEESFSILFPEL